MRKSLLLALIAGGLTATTHANVPELELHLDDVILSEEYLPKKTKFQIDSFVYDEEGPVDSLLDGKTIYHFFPNHIKSGEMFFEKCEYRKELVKVALKNYTESVIISKRGKPDSLISYLRILTYTHAWSEFEDKYQNHKNRNEIYAKVSIDIANHLLQPIAGIQSYGLFPELKFIDVNSPKDIKENKSRNIQQKLLTFMVYGCQTHPEVDFAEDAFSRLLYYSKTESDDGLAAQLFFEELQTVYKTDLTESLIRFTNEREKRSVYNRIAKNFFGIEITKN